MAKTTTATELVAELEARVAELEKSAAFLRSFVQCLRDGQSVACAAAEGLKGLEKAED